MTRDWSKIARSKYLKDLGAALSKTVWNDPKMVALRKIGSLKHEGGNPK